MYTIVHLICVDVPTRTQRGIHYAPHLHDPGESTVVSFNTRLC